MKIALIHQAFATRKDPGGTRHLELGRRLVQRGHSLTVIASDVNYATGQRITARPALFSFEEEDGLQIVRAYTLASLHRNFVARVFSFVGFMCMSFIAGMRIKNPDIVIGTTPPIFQAFTAWAISFLRNKPFLLEVRDLWPEFAINIGVLKNPVLIALSRWLETFLYRRATHIMVNSPAYRDYIWEKGIPLEKITLIPNGVDPKMFASGHSGAIFRERVGAGERFVATYAGAIGLANDLDVLIEAAGLLEAERPDILFVVVGDGKEKPRLVALAESRGLRNLIFTGAMPKSDMAEVLAGSDVCIAVLRDIPMFTMTYPNKVFDYMAAGKPTVLAIGGVIRQVVEDANGGIPVSPGDARALCDAVSRLADHKEESRQMGISARDYVSLHFNRDHQAVQLEELLLRIVLKKT